MNRNLKKGFATIVICTLFTAMGQLFFKQGANNLEGSLLSLITNYNLLLGFLFYAMGAFLFIFALRFGDLSVIYPFVSLTFIWVTFLAFWILKETLTPFKIGAIIFIVSGVTLIARGSDHGR